MYYKHAKYLIFIWGRWVNSRHIVHARGRGVEVKIPRNAQCRHLARLRISVSIREFTFWGPDFGCPHAGPSSWTRFFHDFSITSLSPNFDSFYSRTLGRWGHVLSYSPIAYELRKCPKTPRVEILLFAFFWYFSHSARTEESLDVWPNSFSMHCFTE